MRKKKLIHSLNKIFLISALMVVMATPKEVKADEFLKVKATAYCLNKNLTAMETQPRYGVVAGKREWLGSTMIAWLDDGDGQIKPENYYGTFSCEDVGGSDAIKAGYVIDVWIEGYENAKNFGCKNMIIQIIDSEG